MGDAASPGGFPGVVANRQLDLGWTPSGYCGLLTIDIVSFCDHSRSDHVRQYLRDALYNLLHKGLACCRMSIDDYYYEDRGDGVVVAVAPHIRTAVLVSSLIDWIHAGLRRHNEVSSQAAQMQLRVGIHAGEVETDDHGLVGTAVNHVFRLMDAPVVKQILADSAAGIALITSDRVYEDVVRQSSDLVEPAEYQSVEVRTKETIAPAWVRLLGRARGIGPVMGSFQAPAARTIGRSITSFVGRDRELADVHKLMVESRLVTPGRTGRSRQDSSCRGSSAGIDR